MTYTISQRDALRAAIASGVLRLSYDGKTVEYRSVDELRAALREVDAALAREAGRTTVRQIRVTTGKGL